MTDSDNASKPLSSSWPDGTPRTAGGGGPASASCELCEAAKMSHWYHEDDVCWVADCEVCDTPMVVWRPHGTTPPESAVIHMIDRLSDAARSRFGGDAEFSIDRVMRQIPEHFHAHARDKNWWARRFSRS